MSNKLHTPTPWSVVQVNGSCSAHINADSFNIASVWGRNQSDKIIVDRTRKDGETWPEMMKRTQPLRDEAISERYANAQHIVKCVNAYDELIQERDAAQVEVIRLQGLIKAFVISEAEEE